MLAGPAVAGSIWTELQSPTATLLNAIKFVNRVEGWVIGDRGTVIRYKGGAWSNFPSGTDEDLYSIALLGDGQAWAVGNNGTIVHYDGTRWRVDPQSRTLTLLPLMTVRFLAPDIGWAVGGKPCQPGVALRYNGVSWISATTTIDPLYGVEVLADDNVWFCGGNRRLMHFDGQSFSKLACSGLSDGKAWYALAFPYLNTGYVVGEGGFIWKYSTMNPGPCFFAADPASASLTTQALRGISMLPAQAGGMIVGDAGIRIRWNPASQRFETDADGGQDLRGVDVVNEDEGQVVGGTMVSETNIVWGTVSGTYPNGTCPQRGELGSYADSFVAPGAVFFRIRARLAGVDYFSPEYSIALDAGVCDPWDSPGLGDGVPSGAVNLIPNGAVQSHGPHCLNPADGADWYRIDAVKGATYLLNSVYQNPGDPVAVLGSTGDVQATVYIGAGITPVAYDDNTGANFQFRISFTATADGSYYLEVTTVNPIATWQGVVEYSVSGAPKANITVTSFPPKALAGGTANVSWDLDGFDSRARIASFRGRTTAADLSRVRVFPNPFDPGMVSRLTFDHLPADVDRIDIYTLRGELIGSLGSGIVYDPVTGIAAWEGKVRGGKPAATGSYPWRMHSRSGGTARGLIVVVKQ